MSKDKLASNYLLGILFIFVKKNSSLPFWTLESLQEAFLSQLKSGIKKKKEKFLQLEF